MRGFQETDLPDPSPVTIIGESVARRLFGGQEVLGKRVRYGRLNSAERFTIVGVVKDFRNNGPEHPRTGTVYVLNSQLPESARGSRAAAERAADRVFCLASCFAVGHWRIRAGLLRVHSRTNEIGVRMALGTRPVVILAMMTRESLWTGVVGVSLGLLASVAASRLLTSMLFEVKPAAPHILAAGALLVIEATLSVTFLAARRALWVDPVIALRAE